MIVIVHDAVREDSYLLGHGPALEDVEEIGLGCVIKEYLLSAMTSIHDVVERTLIGQSCSAHCTMLNRFCQNVKHRPHVVLHLK